MKIALIIPSLQPGGAERVLSTIANFWAVYGRKVTILTLDPLGAQPFFSLEPAIEHRSLALAKESPGTFSGLWNNAWRLLVLREALKTTQPDVIISFLTETNVLTLLSARFLEVPVIVAEHSDPYRCPVSRPWAALRRFTYPSAHKIVVLTGAAKSFFSPKLQQKIEVVPNPVTMSDAGQFTGRRTERENVVLAVGRLSDEKGFDLLLRAFSLVAPEQKAWRIVVVGDGPEREGLEQLAIDLGIADRVTFCGVVREPRAFYQRASVFALSSRYEGFPMALCEAMAYGCPVIAAEYNASVFDLIEPGENGLVVPREDIDELSSALRKLMSDSALRDKLGSAARDITKRYGIRSVMRIWESLMPHPGFYDKAAGAKHGC